MASGNSMPRIGATSTPSSALRPRNAVGLVDLLSDGADALRGWVLHAAQQRADFAVHVRATHARLHARTAGEPAHAAPFDALPCFDGAVPVDNGGRLWRQAGMLADAALARRHARTGRHAGAGRGACSTILRRVRRPFPTPVVLVEDSAGHAVSRACRDAVRVAVPRASCGGACAVARAGTAADRAACRRGTQRGILRQRAAGAIAVCARVVARRCDGAVGDRPRHGSRRRDTRRRRSAARAAGAPFRGARRRRRP